MFGGTAPLIYQAAKAADNVTGFIIYVTRDHRGQPGGLHLLPEEPGGDRAGPGAGPRVPDRGGGRSPRLSGVLVHPRPRWVGPAGSRAVERGRVGHPRRRGEGPERLPQRGHGGHHRVRAAGPVGSRPAEGSTAVQITVTYELLIQSAPDAKTSSGRRPPTPSRCRWSPDGFPRAESWALTVPFLEGRRDLEPLLSQGLRALRSVLRLKVQSSSHPDSRDGGQAVPSPARLPGLTHRSTHDHVPPSWWGARRTVRTIGGCASKPVQESDQTHNIGGCRVRSVQESGPDAQHRGMPHRIGARPGPWPLVWGPERPWAGSMSGADSAAWSGVRCRGAGWPVVARWRDPARADAGVVAGCGSAA